MTTEQLSLWLPSSVERSMMRSEHPRATTTTVTKPLSDEQRVRQAPRSWGSIRATRNGRFQARFPDPTKDGLLSACGTFSTYEEAESALEEKKRELESTPVEPQPAAESLSCYATGWLAHRTGLAPRTRALYAQELRDHLLPALGNHPIDSVTPELVREWYAGLHGAHPVAAAKCYRLLRQIFGQAVDDAVIDRNPCRIKGGGVEHSPERPIIGVEDIRQLVEAAPQHFRMVVLCASWMTLRRGEILGLKRGDFDLEAGTLRIVRTIGNLNGKEIVGSPKSKAGARTLTIPAAIIPAIAEHLSRFVSDDADSWVVVGEKGNRLTIEMTGRLWRETRAKLDLGHLHLHDLRHSGAVLVASTGAPLKQVMARLGHSSMRAAMIYQHAVEQQDQAIADGLSRLAG